MWCGVVWCGVVWWVCPPLPHLASVDEVRVVHIVLDEHVLAVTLDLFRLGGGEGKRAGEGRGLGSRVWGEVEVRGMDERG